MKLPRILTCGIGCLVLLSPSLVSAQIEGREATSPQLRLEIVLLKQVYGVGETVSLKYRLTSLADGTLCFPGPSAEWQDEDLGYFDVEITPPKGVEEREVFIESFYPRGRTEEELREDVIHRWVKLGPFEPYQTPKAGKTMVPTAPGDWILQSTYYPPSFKGQRRTMITSLGCSPPDRPVRSRPIKITVEGR